ncbi:hypothetical protein HHI36_008933 [Cryptolaemus montrouzieri]|uniref:Uncharacterized protein n=1 Tax=Cryptolaemus montrouzieri TaxID=559131 RepID=A0ABD2MUS7_9CUCU
MRPDNAKNNGSTDICMQAINDMIKARRILLHVISEENIAKQNRLRSGTKKIMKQIEREQQAIIIRVENIQNELPTRQYFKGILDIKPNQPMTVITLKYQNEKFCDHKADIINMQRNHFYQLLNNEVSKTWNIPNFRS